jgi:hypothetical protein
VQLTRAYKERILDGARGWEDKMAVVGVIDLLGLAQRLGDHLHEIGSIYRCILVDEVQDFGNVELEIVRALVAPAENDLFLCGDAAQAVTSKFQCFRDAGVMVSPARSRRLSLNYRNSRDVLTAAYRVLFQNMTVEMLDREDLEILDPEYSAFTGSTPLMLRADSFARELPAAIAFVRERLADLPEGKACIAVCGYSLFELSAFGRSIDLPVLDGSTSLEAGHVFLSDLEQTKGFEFDVVCIVNCSQGTVPDAAAPEEELYRDLARLYVAMTRAKTDLVVSWSGEASQFLRNAKETFLEADWSDYVGDEPIKEIDVPTRLEALRSEGAKPSWRVLSGDEFLYTQDGIGLSVDFIAKIRQLVDGRGLRRMDQSLRWKTMGAAIDTVSRDSRARNLWGPEGTRQLQELARRLG